METKTPASADTATVQLQALGAQIRAHRKALRISATAAAEAAGLSRVTLHRIENGGRTVTMGAYANVLAALGMAFHASAAGTTEGADSSVRKGWIPARIALAEYPQLKSLAWHVHGTSTLTPNEALDIYERNARHLDMKVMPDNEQDLLEALRQAFTNAQPHV